MINADYALNYLPLVSAYLKGENHQAFALKEARPAEYNPYNEDNGVLFASEKNSIYQISDSGYWQSPEDAPRESIAVINITGAITKYNQTCGPSGMVTKSDLITRCFNNDNIEGVILKVDSGGGESIAWRHIKDALSLKNKAVIGFADDCACSAAYGLLSSCDMIVANSELAQIGSIGTYGTILDYRDKLEKEGIKLIEIYASQSKDKNLEFREALDGNTKPLQEKIDVITEDFITTIETARADKLQSGRETWGTGKTFYAKEALEIGLIDKIDTFNNILKYFNS